MPHPLTAIRGIGPAAAALLVEAGFATIADIAGADLADLSSVRGFGITRAAAIRDDAARLVSEAASPVEAASEDVEHPEPATSGSPRSEGSADVEAGAAQEAAEKDSGKAEKKPAKKKDKKKRAPKKPAEKKGEKEKRSSKKKDKKSSKKKDSKKKHSKKKAATKKDEKKAKKK
ncbi:MAG: helix-hairpin-helix domain-containing protein [Acidobacteriota bacterium]